VLVAAAVVPTPPLLVPEVAGGTAPVDADLRAAALAATARLLATAPDRVVVVGAAPRTQVATGGWDFRPYGVAHPPTAPAQPLPLALAIGAWLLDQLGGPPCPVVLQGVAPAVPRQRAAELGAALVADGRVGLLVCGDGSARRDPKAPGAFDERAEGFDAALVEALHPADPAGLLALDPLLAEALMVSGLAALQVLAGAAAGGTWTAQVDYAAAPYGVGYAVAGWVQRDLT
jgi:hypothetical protein